MKLERINAELLDLASLPVSTCGALSDAQLEAINGGMGAAEVGLDAAEIGLGFLGNQNFSPRSRGRSRRRR